MKRRTAGLSYQATTQRALDRAVCVVVSVAASPLIVLSAMLVRATSPGPILFRQERIGFGGEPFEILKFRTMADGKNPLFPEDCVITPVGKWLRRLSLDELPQLLNVWRGEMSIVGPRPTLRYQVERYTGRQLQRLTVRPGITGLAQVEGRNDLPWADRIEIDLEYVEAQSLRLDLQIIIRSFTSVASGEGAQPMDDPLSAIPVTAEPEAA